MLDLAAARDLLTPLPRFLPGTLDRLDLDAVRPGGGLHDLRFRFVHRPGLPPRWAASGHVEGLSLDAYGHFPGVRGLTTELAATERTGRLVFSGADLSLELPRLFPHRLRFDTAAGEVRWQRENDGELRLSAREITADNADLATRSRFSIRLLVDGGGPFLDLHTEFHDLAFAKIPDYLPSKILREKLTGWFEHAFVGGGIPHGALLFRGAVADFPFDAQQGRFQALLAVRDGTLDFHRDWPPLTAAVGEVRFENRGMRIDLSEGRLLDSDLIQASARIPDLGRAVAVEVQGRVEGPFADDLRILGETPLRRRLGVLAQVFKSEGKARLELDMAIPLRKGDTDSLRLAGELSWPGPAVLAIPDQNIDLTELAGKLRFTDRDLQARSLEASLWGVPVRLGVATRRSGKNAAATTQIRVTGRFPTAVLARKFPAQAWELLQGRARLALDLTLTKANLGESVPPLDFELTSDLTGLALALPAPLGKPAAETRRLRLSGRLARKEMLRIQGAYGDLGIALGLDRGNDGRRRLVRGAFNLGGPALPLPEREGFYLGWPGAPGRFSAADLKGRIRIDLGAGSLLEVEPGVGRVLGILNLETLRRRLSLDFNDLFGPGYAFEKVSGRFDIKQGLATIRELLIEGPSADVSIAGSTDLVARELDQIVTIMPHIGTGVAIAGAVAVGPWSGRPSSWSIRCPIGRSISWAAISTTSVAPGPSPGSGAADARSGRRKRQRPGRRGTSPLRPRTTQTRIRFWTGIDRCGHGWWLVPV